MSNRVGSQAAGVYGVPPDYLAIGHISRDVMPLGYMLGGTVAYAGLTARRLGLRVAIVTSAGPGLQPATMLPGVAVVCVPASATTSFCNTYHGGVREQRVRAVAGAIGIEHIPTAWLGAKIIHLAPLAGEFGNELVDGLAGVATRDTVRSHPIIGITLQGWLRAWNGEGRVRTVHRSEFVDWLRGVQVAMLSEEDLGWDMRLAERYAGSVDQLIVTRGAAGATLWRGNRVLHFPAFVARAVDATGAGDVFAAAYLIQLSRTNDPEEAAVFANCVASFAIEGKGTGSLPTPAQVRARLRGEI